MNGLFAAVSTAPNGGWIGRWSPEIGDPTIGGWITVVVYLLAAVLCWRVLQLLDVRTPKRERRLWRLLFWLLVGLGVNKQLDLQTALTELGRVLAFQQGWYGERRVVQVAFVVMVGLVAVGAGGTLLAMARHLPKATKRAVTGLVMLLGFVAVRASSFHHVDQLLGSSLLGLKANWLLELGGLSVICYGAAKRVTIHRPAPTRARQVPRR